MATDLGQLVYTLTLNDEGFQGQLSGASEKVKSSSGQMTGSLKETEEQSGKTGGAFAGMAGQFVAGQAIFTIAQKGLEVLTGSIKDGVKQFELWQQNQAQIANSLKQTGDASGQTTKGLNEYADAMTNQTGISGNAINSAQLVMLNFKAIGKDIFPEATKQVANFATVLSHGATPNTDEMNAAAKKLGTALEDPAKGMLKLKMAGVVLTADQQTQIKNMEKSGNLMGAQKQLLSDVSDVIGGKAATASHTLAGEQAMMHAQIEKVQIEIGQKLTAAFKAIEPYLAKFIDFLMKHKPILEAIAVTIGILAAVIVGAMVAALWSAVAGFLALSASMLPVILVAVAIGIVAVLIMTYWKDLKQWFSDFIKDIKQWFDDGLKFIKDHWALIVDIILGPLGIVITTVIQHWSTIKAGFLDAVNFVKSVWGGIVGFFSAIWQGITGAVGQVGNVLRGVFRDAFNAIIGLWDDTMGKLFHGQRIGVGPVHFDLPNLNIPKMADGGIVNTATLALIGEAGPEAVVPLNKAGSNANVGSSTYNFQPGSVILSTAEAVDEFFNIGNRNLQLEQNGMSPLAGTSGI
jgi:hypothetical protein